MAYNIYLLEKDEEGTFQIVRETENNKYTDYSGCLAFVKVSPLTRLVYVEGAEGIVGGNKGYWYKLVEKPSDEDGYTWLNVGKNPLDLPICLRIKTLLGA